MIHTAGPRLGVFAFLKAPLPCPCVWITPAPARGLPCPCSWTSAAHRRTHVDCVASPRFACCEVMLGLYQCLAIHAPSFGGVLRIESSCTTPLTVVYEYSQPVLATSSIISCSVTSRSLTQLRLTQVIGSSSVSHVPVPGCLLLCNTCRLVGLAFRLVHVVQPGYARCVGGHA